MSWTGHVNIGLGTARLVGRSDKKRTVPTTNCSLGQSSAEMSIAKVIVQYSLGRLRTHQRERTPLDAYHHIVTESNKETPDCLATWLWTGPTEYGA